jgi:hypothetical protein
MGGRGCVRGGGEGGCLSLFGVVAVVDGVVVAVVAVVDIAVSV